MGSIESSSVIVSRQHLAAFEEREADGTLVRLRGEHDISTVAALSETFDRAIALDDADLVVDLSGVQFMDAATIGAIVCASNALRLRSRSLVVRSPSRCARLVIDPCGLGDLLEARLVTVPAMTGPASALGTWVAVPATDRVDRRADASAPEAVRVDRRIPAAIPAVLTANLSGRGGP